MRAAAFTLVLSAVVALVALIGPGVREWWLADRCADSGGRWDFQSARCLAPAR